MKEESSIKYHNNYIQSRSLCQCYKKISEEINQYKFIGCDPFDKSGRSGNGCTKATFIYQLINLIKT